MGSMASAASMGSMDSMGSMASAASMGSMDSKASMASAASMGGEVSIWREHMAGSAETDRPAPSFVAVLEPYRARARPLRRTQSLPHARPDAVGADHEVELLTDRPDVRLLPY